ncbi:hypothetical protein M0Q97_07550 [Candidatus Dojkabacteria bacterium]|jgi:hypothetical protein|nr:hypothetical protein [Candidatus Dojkabacteria bacterium]
MKKPKTKRKLSITLNDKIYLLLNNFENKSKYIEYLIYEDIKKNDLLKKDIIL